MLSLRPNCESCDKDLPTESRETYICSFECIFCHRCVTEKLRGVCPNSPAFTHRKSIRIVELR